LPLVILASEFPSADRPTVSAEPAAIPGLESFARMPDGAPAEAEPAGDDDSTETFPAIVASVPGPIADQDPPEPGNMA